MTNRPDKPFELNSNQIVQLIKLAQFKCGDVFYDLGCAEGKVVIEVAKLGKIKKSIGIEKDIEPYEIARKAAIKELTPRQLRKADFVLAEMDVRNSEGDYFYDLSDGNVIYFSLEQSEEDLEWYRDRFRKTRLKIITKDLPLVGCKSDANREDNDCWLFLMTKPFQRLRSKQKWIESVLGVKGLTMDHVYSYYGGQLSKRKAYKKKDIIESLLELQKVVNRRF